MFETACMKTGTPGKRAQPWVRCGVGARQDPTIAENTLRCLRTVVGMRMSTRRASRSGNSERIRGVTRSERIGLDGS